MRRAQAIDTTKTASLKTRQSKKKTSGGSLIFGWYFLKPPNHFLGGGFNPLEKSNWIICPNRDENKKYLKPPPSISHSRSTSVPGFQRTVRPVWLSMQ